MNYVCDVIYDIYMIWYMQESIGAVVVVVVAVVLI